MSIKPIDAQLLMNNSPDIARMQSHEANREVNSYAASAQKVQQQNQLNSERISASEKSTETKLERKNKDQPKEQQKKKKKQNNQGQGSKIDIRI